MRCGVGFLTRGLSREGDGGGVQRGVRVVARARQQPGGLPAVHVDTRVQVSGSDGEGLGKVVGSGGQGRGFDFLFLFFFFDFFEFF